MEITTYLLDIVCGKMTGVSKIIRHPKGRVNIFERFQYWQDVAGYFRNYYMNMKVCRNES